MIKTLKVKNLNSRHNLDLSFNDDLNLLTGKNGSSKTTLLKLIWFLNSGQLANLLQEVNFEFAEIVTSNYTATIERQLEKGLSRFQLNSDPVQTYNDDQIRQLSIRHPRYRKMFMDFRKVAIPTIFFPTFRRIEGGFSMDRQRAETPFDTSPIKEALSQLSNMLSSGNQRFVASLSTDDLVILITQEYARITQSINAIQQKHSEQIIQKIKNREQDDKDLLKSIQKDIEETERIRVEAFKPFTILSELVQSIFQYKGISLNTQTIGDVGDAISSEKLSAGEKQMLSFLCYNTFTQNASIFIDEPELSLHPDWQRSLLPTLLAQGNNNQFFMATHSPFIYSKYPDKEIIMGRDRGDN